MKIMKRLQWSLVFALLLASANSNAQSASQIVQWTLDAGNKTTLAQGEKMSLHLSAKIKDGWHVYALSQAPGGPTPLTVQLAEGSILEPNGAAVSSLPKVVYDKNFEMETRLHEHSIEITLPVKVKQSAASGSQVAVIDVRFQTCNEQNCLPPATVHPSVNLVVMAAPPMSASTSEVTTSAASDRKASATAPPPVLQQMESPSANANQRSQTAAPETPVKLQDITSQGLYSFLWMSLGMGALSLLTPCVFPMIPITVSYFTKQTACSRAGAVLNALVFALGIVLSFTALGLLLAALFGATGVNQLAANPRVNLLITAIFIGFSLTLFGVYFLQIPPSLVSRLDSVAHGKGSLPFLGTLLMGLTFTLTSFTCTSPFVGTLLVMASQGSWKWPVLGMICFSTVFALPFFLLALAPQWMARLPRAGSWMNSVKVVMGLLEIAAAMKFLSNADLIWGWEVFTRDVVLSVWVATGVLTVFYLLGIFRLGQEAPPQGISAPRMLLALAFITITIWLSLGLQGRSLGTMESFLPPAIPQGSSSADASLSGIGRAPDRGWILNDYEAALAQARKESKLVFIDFTGYTCTNCRWMEANMFTKPEVSKELSRMIRVRLYTDGAGDLYQHQQQMQQAKFGTVALPLYALVRADGSIVKTYPGLTRDVHEFVSFLQSK